MFYANNLKLTGNGLVFSDKNGRRLTTSQAVSKAVRRVYSWGQDFKLFWVNLIGGCPFWTVRKLIYRLAGVGIGRGAKIHVFCRFFEPGNIVLGQDSIVGEFAFLDGRAPLSIGNHTDIASQVLIYNSEHDINNPGFVAVDQPVKIGDYVFIGPRAIILPGVSIGNGAVVAAGAVVTKNVPEGKIFAGVPAREIGERKLKDFAYRLGRTRLFQ